MFLRSVITCLCFILLHPALSAAKWNEIEAFTRPGSTLHSREARNQQLVFSSAPDGKPATRLTWEFDKLTYAEVNLASPVTFDSFKELEIELDYNSEGLRQLNSCGMRIIDATGEVFQWSLPVTDNAPGWKSIRHAVTAANFTDSWGQNSNKVIDFPARLIGFGAGFGHNSSGPVWFGGMRYRIPGEKPKIAARALRWEFDDRAEWWTSWGAARMHDKRIDSGQRGDVFMNERMFAVHHITSGRELRLDCVLERGSAGIELSICDGSGKRQPLPRAELKPGKNRLVFPLAGLVFPLRLDAIRINGTSPEFKIRMERLELRSDMEPAAAVNVTAETGHPLHLMLPGTDRTAQLTLENRSEEKLALAGNFTISDFFGELASFSRDIDLAPGETCRIPIDTAPFPKDGIFYIGYTLRDRGAQEDEGFSGQTSFARMTPAGPTPGRASGFLFSICTHTERWGTRDRELEVLATALSGAKVVRSYPEWGNVQPAKDKWNYDLYDHLIDLYGKAGIELQAGFGLCTYWGKSADAKLRNGEPDRLDNARSMPDLELWRKYVYNTVARYRGKVRYWEVWNEPDLTHFANFGVDDFVRLMAASYNEARKADPDAKILNGGFAGLTSPDQIAYQKRFLETAKGTFDVHAFHQHGDFELFRQVIDNVFLPQRRESGTTAPWYANETALHSLGGQERFQAETLFTKLIFAWARGAIGYTWYDLRNDGFSATDAEHNYGMVTNDFHPKAVYPAFAALVSTYRDMHFDRELPLAPGEYAFLFRDENTLTLAAWREASTSDAAGGLYVGTTDGSAVRRVDLMGNREVLPFENGKFLYQPGRTPETLLIEGGTRLEFAPILKARTIGPAAKGRNVTLEFALTNPLDTELVLNCTLNAPAPFHATDNEFQLKAAPGKTSLNRLALAVDGDPGATVRRIPLAVTVPGGGRAELALPIYPAQRIPSKPDGKAPDFTLDRRSQVTSLYDKVPGHSIWQGPDDLSAQITLGLDRNALVVRALVTDDIHRQNDSAARIWAGDSVQLYFTLPGQYGSWELGGALLADGRSQSWVWSAPAGFEPDAVRAATDTAVKRSDGRTSYEFRIPFGAVGLTPAICKEGFRFNLLVNDSDVPGDEREGWIRIAPGAGDERKPLKHPVIFFE